MKTDAELDAEAAAWLEGIDGVARTAGAVLAGDGADNRSRPRGVRQSAEDRLAAHRRADRKWYAAHREQNYARCKRWCAANRERRNEAQRVWRMKQRLLIQDGQLKP